MVNAEIRSTGGLYWTQYQIIGFHKRKGHSCITDRLLPPQMWQLNWTRCTPKHFLYSKPCIIHHHLQIGTIPLSCMNFQSCNTSTKFQSYKNVRWVWDVYPLLTSIRRVSLNSFERMEIMSVVVPRSDLRCFYICLEVMNSHENVIINAFGNVTPLILVDIFGGPRGWTVV
jgi:hypothetical protein